MQAAVLHGRVFRGAGVSIRIRERSLVVAAVLLAVIVGTGLWSLAAGDFPLALHRVLATLAGQGEGGENFIVLGLRLPRSSRELATMQGPRIAPDLLAGGDLVFFGSGGTVSHVGIYVGEGRFVHAPSSGGTVRLDRLDGSWWREHYSGARRLLL